MDQKKIARINELYHKEKKEGLSPEEKEEQVRLREEYIESFLRNLRGQLDRIDILEKDGSITHVKDLYKKGKKRP
jgi:uncharacterized protein YnzC (UPF0291/DUF896 family)